VNKKDPHHPIKDEDLEDLRVGDVVYLTGHLVTCRDVAHRRLIELKRELPVDLKGGAIFHAGPIVRKKDDGKFEMVSIGPTTSMRMEKFEREFIEQTGVKLIVGKGGMGPETEAGCRKTRPCTPSSPAAARCWPPRRSRRSSAPNGRTWACPRRCGSTASRNSAR
jgi:L(+)-tartrate dehydratase beta subunit